MDPEKTNDTPATSGIPSFADLFPHTETAQGAEVVIDMPVETPNVTPNVTPEPVVS